MTVCEIFLHGGPPWGFRVAQNETLQPVVTQLLPDGIAETSGMLIGDLLESVDDESVQTVNQMHSAVRKANGQMRVVVFRKSSDKSVHFSPSTPGTPVAYRKGNGYTPIPAVHLPSASPPSELFDNHGKGSTKEKKKYFEGLFASDDLGNGFLGTANLLTVDDPSESASSIGYDSVCADFAGQNPETSRDCVQSYKLNSAPVPFQLPISAANGNNIMEEDDELRPFGFGPRELDKIVQKQLSQVQYQQQREQPSPQPQQWGMRCEAGNEGGAQGTVEVPGRRSVAELTQHLSGRLEVKSPVPSGNGPRQRSLQQTPQNGGRDTPSEMSVLKSRLEQDNSTKPHLGRVLDGPANPGAYYQGVPPQSAVQPKPKKSVADSFINSVSASQKPPSSLSHNFRHGVHPGLSNNGFADPTYSPSYSRRLFGGSVQHQSRLTNSPKTGQRNDSSRSPSPTSRGVHTPVGLPPRQENRTPVSWRAASRQETQTPTLSQSQTPSLMSNQTQLQPHYVDVGNPQSDLYTPSKASSITTPLSSSVTSPNSAYSFTSRPHSPSSSSCYSSAVGSTVSSTQSDISTANIHYTTPPCNWSMSTSSPPDVMQDSVNSLISQHSGNSIPTSDHNDNTLTKKHAESTEAAPRQPYGAPDNLDSDIEQLNDLLDQSVSAFHNGAGTAEPVGRSEQTTNYERQTTNGYDQAVRHQTRGLIAQSTNPFAKRNDENMNEIGKYSETQNRFGNSYETGESEREREETQTEQDNTMFSKMPPRPLPKPVTPVHFHPISHDELNTPMSFDFNDTDSVRSSAMSELVALTRAEPALARSFTAAPPNVQHARLTPVIFDRIPEEPTHDSSNGATAMDLESSSRSPSLFNAYSSNNADHYGTIRRGRASLVSPVPGGARVAQTYSNATNDSGFEENSRNTQDAQSTDDEGLMEKRPWNDYDMSTWYRNMYKKMHKVDQPQEKAQWNYNDNNHIYGSQGNLNRVTSLSAADSSDSPAIATIQNRRARSVGRTFPADGALRNAHRYAWERRRAVHFHVPTWRLPRDGAAHPGPSRSPSGPCLPMGDVCGKPSDTRSNLCMRCGWPRRDPTWAEVDNLYNKLDETTRKEDTMKKVQNTTAQCRIRDRLDEAAEELEEFIKELDLCWKRSQSSPCLKFPVQEVGSELAELKHQSQEEQMYRQRAERLTEELEAQRTRRHGYVPSAAPTLHNNVERFHGLLNDYGRDSPSTKLQRLREQSATPTLSGRRSVAPPTTVITCTAIYKFTAHSERELSLNKGDVVRLHREIDQNWLEGERNGKLGIFPRSYVKIDPEYDTAAVKFRVVYPFTSRNDNEMSLKIGEIVTYRREIDANWMEGSNHIGEIGIFPSCYVRRLEDTEVVPADVPGRPKTPHIPQARYEMERTPEAGDEPTLCLPHPVPTSDEVNGTLRSQHARESERTLDSRRQPTSYSTQKPQPSYNTPQAQRYQPAQLAAPGGQTYSGDYSSQQAQYQTSYETTSNGRVVPAALSGTLTKTQNQNATYNEQNRTDTFGEEADEDRSEHCDKLSAWQQKNKQSNLSGTALLVPKNSETYRAVYGYKPCHEDELELQINDIVFVVEKCDDGWYIGTLLRTGQFGTFPGNYVVKH